VRRRGEASPPRRHGDTETNTQRGIARHSPLPFGERARVRGTRRPPLTPTLSALRGARECAAGSAAGRARAPVDRERAGATGAARSARRGGCVAPACAATTGGRQAPEAWVVGTAGAVVPHASW
jgi:hypothetical protein